MAGENGNESGANGGNPGAGGEGNPGGGNPGDAGAQGGQGGQGGQNNNEITTPLHTGLWDNPKDETAAAPAAPVAPAAPGTSKTPEEIMNDHIAGLGLDSNVNVEGLTEALNNGDTKPLLAMLQTTASNTYKAAIESTAALVDKKVAAAVEKAVSTAEGNVNSGLALQEMHKALPFTDAPDVSPVADAVMTKLIKDGKSVSEAIAGTSGFFKAVTEQGVDHFDSIFEQRPGSGDPRRGTPKTDEYWSDLLQGITE